MKYLDITGPIEEKHKILQEIVMSGQAQVNESGRGLFENSYSIHEYEAILPVRTNNYSEENETKHTEDIDMENMMVAIKTIGEELGINLYLEKETIRQYTINKAIEDYNSLNKSIGPHINSIKDKKKEIIELESLYGSLKGITKQIDFDEINNLKDIKCEIGTLSKTNRRHVHKNKENISAIILEIGEDELIHEKIYMVIYPLIIQDEVSRLLKALNFKHIKDDILLNGEIEDSRKKCLSRINILKNQIARLEEDLIERRGELVLCINKIYTRLKLDMKIKEMGERISKGNSVFGLSLWIRERDEENLIQNLDKVTSNYHLRSKKVDEVDEESVPPTKLRNNWLIRPFEMIVRLYGLPQYREMDPTSFLGLTFCLMFGIMFGDIGQGLIYFLAGVAISGKMKDAGGILRRLGGTSMIFGLVYGSVFGLEHLPIISDIALVKGGPLGGDNIMNILIAGVVFGIVVLSMAFFIGIANLIKQRDYENALFGKNGVAGYIFFMGLVITILVLIGTIKISVMFSVLGMVIVLIIMIIKEPLVGLIKGKSPIIEGDIREYFIESSFEGIETILSTLSNTISFIRIGAFALNHAGLFLAFLKMSEMIDNIVAKIAILAIGNVLILTLEGLVVFIQGLRLEYYELFSKYFKGGGTEFKVVSLE